MTTEGPIEITKEAFDKCADAAAMHNGLKGREGEHGKEFAIFLNGHKMMSSTVDEDGERHYYSHIG